MSKGSNTLNQQTAKPSRSVLFGAAFLMATSAIGPGFLTQTSKFTAQFGTALSLVIVLAIIMDITAQMNIWSVVSVSGMRAQDVANKLLPGLGVVIAILVAIGGLAFNVGNVGGVALGFNAMFGLNEKIGAAIAGCLGIIIFVNKNAKTIMDKVATVLAAVILLTVATVAVISKPPVGEAVSSLAQLGNLGNKDLLLALTTLLGGSCGGYIAFSGAHRLLDAGISGPENISHVRRSVLQGCGTSGLVRILLFLAVLGTCAMASGNAATIIAASEPFISAAPRPNNMPSRMVGSNGGLIQRSASPGGTTSVCPAKANVSPCPRHAQKFCVSAKSMRSTVKPIACKRSINKAWHPASSGLREGRRISCCVSSITGHDIDYTSWKNC